MRRLTVGIVLCLVTVAALLAPTAASAATVPSSLPAGSQLTAGTAHHLLRSPAGQFTLELTSWGLFLEQRAPFLDGGATGGAVWTVQPREQNVASLNMQRDGNLVMYDSRHHAVWSTGTRGLHNHLTVLPDGNIAVYSATRQVLWTPGAHPAYMTAGHTLRSGSFMFSQVRTPGPPLLATRLTMRRDGDLVLTYGTRVTWHTNTHVAGSYVELQINGSLVLYSPARRVLWSHVAHAGMDTWLYVNGCGWASLWSQRTLQEYWSTPIARC